MAKTMVMIERTALLFLLLVLGGLLPAPVAAQEENQAGLVVVYGDGRVVQQCVRFAEETISGYDLLRRSGLPSSVEAGAIGPTVCSIGGEGCSFPQESCFCRCQGSPCVYWSYWRLEAGGGWRYQALGAGNTLVADGDVEGWHWAEGTTRDAAAPPSVTFAEICRAAAPGSTAAGAVTAAAIVTAADAPPTEARTPAEAGALPAVGKAADPASAVSGSEPENRPAAEVGEAVVAPAAGSGIWLLLGGVVVVPAVVLLVWALLRKGK
jgi:hypothetical protein